MPLFCISGAICAGFQSQGGFPHLCALCADSSDSGVTPITLLTASMVAEAFPFRYFHTNIGGAQIQDQVCQLLPNSI